MRLAPQIELTQAQREELETLSRGRSIPARIVERAKIVLLAFEGKQNREISEILGVTRRTVGRWRSRFAVKGLRGIEKDAPRLGDSLRFRNSSSGRSFARPPRKNRRRRPTGVLGVWPRRWG